MVGNITGIAQRKIIELKQKLRSLELEFDMWRARSRALGPLEKNYSQIHRVTTQLAGYQEIIREKLNSPVGEAEELLKQSNELEKQILELHRIWEFFRSKFAVRGVEWFNSYLMAADEFAWACYHAAQKRVNPQYVKPDEIKEPPLVFFNGGSSPFSMPRKLAYQAEAVPREGLKTEKFFELLSDLPIPLIGIPWSQIQHLPEALVIGHEVGHIVRDDFQLKARTEALLENGMDNGKIPDERRRAWREWLDEIFADIYGNLATGPAFVGSLMDFVSLGKDDITREQRSSLNWGFYPTTYLRVLLNLEILVKQGLKEESEELKANWQEIYESHAMPEFADDIPPIVESLIDGPYPELGNVALSDILHFSGPNQWETVDETELVLNGGKLQATDVRVLYAAARLAFARDPQDYEQRDVQRKVLNRIMEVQEGGIRAERAQRVESYDDHDKLSGRKLFEKFQLLSGSS